MERGLFMQKTKLGGRFWLALTVFSLVGQVAWVVENMYFNVFVYKMFHATAAQISLMVSASAVVATLTTILIGALSDRVGKRKVFICVGYLLWGISILSFALIRVDVISPMVSTGVAVTTVCVNLTILMDCVMTFFGSTANDAAFNAYITDAIDSGNRGKTESVLAILPLISMLVIFGAFDGMTQRGEWQKFFAIFGGLVTLAGFVGIFLVAEPRLTPKKEPYLKNLVYGLRPSVVKENAALYLAFAAFCVFSVAVQVFFPYLIIYIQNYLKIDNYAVVLGVVLLTASGVSVASGKAIDCAGKLRFTLPAAGVMLLGLIGMFFARGMLAVILAGCIMMSGYMLVTAALSGVIRDLTPEGKAGHFQGIRMIFGVLLPMIAGPAIGAAVIRNSDSTYVELGVTKTVPTPPIFLAAAVVLLFIIPFVLLLKKRAAAREARV